MLPRNYNYNSIQDDRIIPDWPEESRSRLRIGLLKSRSAELTREVIERLLRGLPVESISFDNGSEFSQFHEIMCCTCLTICPSA